MGPLAHQKWCRASRTGVLQRGQFPSKQRRPGPRQWLGVTKDSPWPQQQKLSDQPQPRAAATGPPKDQDMTKWANASVLPKFQGATKGGESKNWQKPMALTVAVGVPKCCKCWLKPHMMKRANAEALSKFHSAPKAGECKNWQQPTACPREPAWPAPRQPVPKLPKSWHPKY